MFAPVGSNIFLYFIVYSSSLIDGPNFIGLRKYPCSSSMGVEQNHNETMNRTHPPYMIVYAQIILINTWLYHLDLYPVLACPSFTTLQLHSKLRIDAKVVRWMNRHTVSVARSQINNLL